MGTQFKNWWIGFRDPKEIWENHPSYLIVEILYYFLGSLTLIHALRKGGRYPYLWLTTVLHGLTVESVSYFVPDIDNFWHGQTMIMLLGRRLPLHIIFFYPIFIYTSVIAVSRLRLKFWAKPFMVGLGVVLMDVPFDIMGIKLLWWSWHDTEPNIGDRHMWVPWTSYYFHATFACSLYVLFHGSRRLFTKTKGYRADSFIKEILCCIIPGAFSFPLGAMQFVPIYHTLHDNFDIHTEICVFMLLSVYGLIVWTAMNSSSPSSKPAKSSKWLDEIRILVTLHYVLYILLTIFSKPEDVKSIGLHETVGDCNAVSTQTSAMGQVQYKKTYLCAENYDEGYFDWHCRKDGKPPKAGTDWYLVCGNAFPNHVEYIVVVSMFSLVGLYMYYQMLSGTDDQESVEPRSMKKQKTK